MWFIALGLCGWCLKYNTRQDQFSKAFFILEVVADLLNRAELGDLIVEADVTVEEAVANLAQMPTNSVLVPKPPLTWGAEAQFVRLTDEYRVPPSVTDAGYQYLLGREDIERLFDFLKSKKVGSRTVAEFIIHYAVNDSPPSWINDVPDR